MKTSLVYHLLKPDFFTVQISIEKAGYMDVKEITSAGVYLDMLAGDSSILRKVFGKSLRLSLYALMFLFLSLTITIDKFIYIKFLSTIISGSMVIVFEWQQCGAIYAWHIFYSVWLSFLRHIWWF